MAERVSKEDFGDPSDGSGEGTDELAAKVAAAAAGGEDLGAVDEGETYAEMDDVDEDAEDLGALMEEEPEAPASRSSVAPEVQEAKPAKAPTRYLVLQSVNVKIGEETVELWRPVGEFDGPKPLDAAHVALEGKHDALVPVPLRSWKPKRPVEKPRPPVVGWE